LSKPLSKRGRLRPINRRRLGLVLNRRRRLAYPSRLWKGASKQWKSGKKSAGCGTKHEDDAPSWQPARKVYLYHDVPFFESVYDFIADEGGSAEPTRDKKDKRHVLQEGLLQCDPGWVVYLVVVEDGGQWS